MKRVYTVFLCMLMVSFFSLEDVFSGEVIFPTPSYEGEELQKVRQWEKTWAGKKVTTENVDQVKEFLHEAVYKAMKEPTIFGAKSLWFEVVPYRPYQISKGKIEATKKYAPTSKIDENEMLAGYGEVAGTPFPQPKTGLEMAWNFDGNTRGDSVHEILVGEVIDCRSRKERKTEQHRWDMYWIGRCDVPPVPKIPDEKNRKGLARSFFQRHAQPADFVDTTMLEVKYIDFKRPEDLWVYTAMFRRIRRYATSQRTDTIDGTDMVYDDHDGWYTHIIHNTYSYKGRADLLYPRHHDNSKQQRITGQGFWSGIQRERINHWVVEVKNKDKDYIYSKQIWYLDPETWQMNFKVMYNRQGQLWKLFEQLYNEYPSYGGEKTAFFSGDHIVDFIRRHGSADRRIVKEIGIDIPLTLYRTKSLKERSY